MAFTNFTGSVQSDGGFSGPTLTLSDDLDALGVVSGGQVITL